MTLPRERAALVDEMVAALAKTPGVVCVVLGGSWARGDGRTDSDVDLGLYYRDDAPLRPEVLRTLAASFQVRGEAEVTGLYVWGPWANGGAWLRTRVGRMDWIYRSVDRVERVIDDARRGVCESHFGQQPPYGYYSVTYVGDLFECVPLHDPTGVIEQLRARVADYPDPLRGSVVQDSLWSVEFTLYAARRSAARGDLYATSGCLTRALAALVQALFALNRTWFTADATAARQIAGFAARPEDWAGAVERILGQLETSEPELVRSVESLQALFDEVRALAGGLYRSNRFP